MFDTIDKQSIALGEQIQLRKPVLRRVRWKDGGGKQLLGTWAPAWWYVCANPLEVVLADLGCAELVWPEERLLWKPRPSDQAVPICTVQYRAPDMLLGSQRFGCGHSAALPRSCSSASRSFNQSARLREKNC